jgi:hypothetical protein
MGRPFCCTAPRTRGAAATLMNLIDFRQTSASTSRIRCRRLWFRPRATCIPEPGQAYRSPGAPAATASGSESSQYEGPSCAPGLLSVGSKTGQGFFAATARTAPPHRRCFPSAVKKYGRTAGWETCQARFFFRGAPVFARWGKRATAARFVRKRGTARGRDNAQTQKQARPDERA